MNQHFQKENDVSLGSSYLGGFRAVVVSVLFPVNLLKFFRDWERSCAFACDGKILLQSVKV